MNRNASTEDFQGVVEKHMTPGMKLSRPTAKMDWFFHEWVYTTPVPRYKLDYTLTDADGGKCLLKATVTQSEVPKIFVMPVPMYIDLDGRVDAHRIDAHGGQFHQQRNPGDAAEATAKSDVELLARYTRSPVNGHCSPAATGTLRRHHDRDGWHRRVGNLYQSVRGGAARPHAVSDSGRVDGGRRCWR